MQTNHDIREAAKRGCVALWRVADELGISEPTMTRTLRRELPPAERERILAIIDQLKVERETEAM